LTQVFVDNVTRRIGGRAILKDISLKVERKETLAIMGPSGSGKTSLLRIINMLDRPDAGKVFIDGQDVWADGESTSGCP